MFNFTEEQLMVRDMARDFAKRELEPIAAQLDERAEFPAEKINMMAELGLMGITMPEEWGGGGMDTVSYLLASEEIARACAGTSVIMMGNNSLVCAPLLKFGNDQQKQKFLTPLASGEHLGCFALTEPNAGSDVAALRTSARFDNGEWVLNGEKTFITNAPNAQTAIVFAVTDKEAGHKGISAFIVPMDTPGVSCGPKEKKMGIRASQSSSIFFEDARVPEENMLSEKGTGFKIALWTLDGGRIGIGAQACGIARAALDEAIAFAVDRRAFGKPIADLQAIQFKIADMATKLETSRLLTFHCARLKDAGEVFTKESAMCKLYASEAVGFITDQALQIHGGYGYTADYNIERHYRDARITQIYEGTSEIQRIVIAANVFKQSR